MEINYEKNLHKLRKILRKNKLIYDVGNKEIFEFEGKSYQIEDSVLSEKRKSPFDDRIHYDTLRGNEIERLIFNIELSEINIEFHKDMDDSEKDFWKEFFYFFEDGKYIPIKFKFIKNDLLGDEYIFEAIFRLEGKLIKFTYQKDIDFWTSQYLREKKGVVYCGGSDYNSKFNFMNQLRQFLDLEPVKLNTREGF